MPTLYVFFKYALLKPTHIMPPEKATKASEATRAARRAELAMAAAWEEVNL